MANYSVPHPYHGLYRALVIDDKDPLLKMRVKVRIPDLMVAEEKFVGKWNKNGTWAFPGNNYLGGRNKPDMLGQRLEAPEGYYQGSCLIPPKGSHVWILFEKNDPSHPYYIAAAEYGDTQALPENQLGKEYQKKWTLLKTAQGRCIIASDDDSDARFEITGKKRKISNPPFGDTDSVYDIDDNQTTFLIDERPNHEKVFLKDYRGNYFKLIQDENGINDQFHGYVQDDVHLEVGKDFYLTVHGNFHLKVDKNIYIQSLMNIFVKAASQLKENAKSFDRYSTVYDNTFSGLINVKSQSNINQDAAMDIYQNSIRNIRNSMVTSDVSTGMTTIQAGGAIGIKSGGATSVFGDGGTAIQSTPVVNPLSGNTDSAKTSPQATKAKPDKERYQDQQFTGKAPILELPTYKDSIAALPFEHSTKPKVQCNNAKVSSTGSSSAGCGGGGSTNSSSNSSNNGGNSSGGSSSSSNSSSGSSTSNANSAVNTSSASKETNSGSRPQSVSVAEYTKEKATKSMIMVSSCNGGSFSNVKMAFKAQTIIDPTNTMLPATLLFNSLNEICKLVSDEISSAIIGITDPLNKSRLTDEIYDLVNNTAEKTSYEFNDSFMKSVANSSINASLSIVNNIAIPKIECLECCDSIYESFVEDRNFLTGTFVNNIQNTLIHDLSQQFDSCIMDEDRFVSRALDDILTACTNGANKINCLDSTINYIADDFSSNVINDTLNDVNHQFNDTVGKLSNTSNEIINDMTRDSIGVVADNIENAVIASNNALRAGIRNSMTFQG